MFHIWLTRKAYMIKGINAMVWISVKICSIHLFFNTMGILGRRKIFLGVWKFFWSLSSCCVRKCCPQIFISVPLKEQWWKRSKYSMDYPQDISRGTSFTEHSWRNSELPAFKREMRVEGKGTYGEGEPTKNHHSSPTKFIEDFFKYRQISSEVWKTSSFYLG